MAFNVTLYSFTKRENSTKRPASGGTDYACTLIDNTSLMEPTFKLTLPANPVGKNYAYVAEFNRYYFITDISSYQNFWYITCTCDVLATYKTEIGSQSHYVLRSASEYDGTISDEIYPADTQLSCYQDYADSPGDPLRWSAGYCFILGIVGYTEYATEQFGSIIYYAMNGYTLKYFLKYLMDNIATSGDNWAGIATTEYSEGVQKALINPIQYIKSCICMPFSVDSITGSLRGAIKFGYYSYSFNGTDGFNKMKIINDDTVVKLKETAYITLRQHPQAATRGSYLNCQPFTRYTLHYGPWGDVDLDPMILQGNNKLKLETLYDLVAGTGRLIVSGNVSTAKVVFNSTVKIGVDINLSQVYKDALGYESALTNQIFTQMGAAMKGDIPAILGAGTAGVQNMTRLDYPTVQGIGCSGSFMSFKDSDNLYLLSRFNHIVDENLAEIGRPLYQTKVINTLSGYILCDKADCQISGTQAEAQKINEYMNTGFFYE